MRSLITLLLAAAFSVLAVVPTHADAAVDVQVNIGLPVAPPLVVVQPGVQVVENWDEEVFFSRGFYWVRRGDVWYRSRSPRASFYMAPRRVVPVALVRMPPGQYVRYRKENHGRYKHEEWREHGGRGHGGEGGHGRGHGHGKWKD